MPPGVCWQNQQTSPVTLLALTSADVSKRVAEKQPLALGTVEKLPHDDFLSERGLRVVKPVTAPAQQAVVNSIRVELTGVQFTTGDGKLTRPGEDGELVVQAEERLFVHTSIKAYPWLEVKNFPENLTFWTAPGGQEIFRFLGQKPVIFWSVRKIGQNPGRVPGK